MSSSLLHHRNIRDNHDTWQWDKSWQSCTHYCGLQHSRKVSVWSRVQSYQLECQIVACRISICLKQRPPLTALPETKWNPVTITLYRNSRGSLPTHVQVILLTLSPRDSMAFRDSETKPSRDLRTSQSASPTATLPTRLSSYYMAS